MNPRLTQLEVEAFRGFADSAVLPLDADAVVITGANGLGKTSVFQAIAWCLTGELRALEERRDRRGDDVIGNCYRPNVPSRVALSIFHPEGDFELVREGSAQENELRLTHRDKPLVGTEASSALAKLLRQDGDEAFKRAVSGWGILGQDEVRSVLNAPAEDLQKQLREILSLGVLDTFEQAAKTFAEGAKKRSNEARGQHKDLESRLATARRQLSDAAGTGEHDVDTAVAEYVAALQAAPSFRAPLPEPLTFEAVEVQLGRFAVVESEITALRHQAGQLAELVERQAAEGRHEEDPQPTVIATLERQIAEHQASAAELAARRSRALDDLERMVALAEVALPLLDEHCPVCAQAIDRAATEARLRQLRDRVLQSDPELGRLTQEMERQQATSAQLVEALTNARRRQSAMEQRALELQRFRNQLAHKVDRTADEIRSMRFETAPLDRKDPSMEQLGEVLAAARRLVVPLEKVRMQLRAAEADASMVKLKLEVSRLEAQVEASSQRLEQVSQVAANADLLRRTSLESALEVTEQALEAIQPYFGEVYRRLAAHPTFQELSVKHEVYYGKARSWTLVQDPVFEIAVNPRVVCSEGQLNVVTLSYFVALALTAGDMGLPFIALDDPLQTLDDANALGFADLCRHLRDQRQLLVSSHDRRFGDLLARKLGPRQSDQSMIQLDFVGWDRSGPTFTTRIEQNSS